jgi:predicted nucleotidyltransferase
MEKFNKAFEEAVAYFKGLEFVEGILVSGSYVNGTLSNTSDIDLFMVIKESNWKEKGIKYFNNIEVEYFLQPYSQVIQYFDREEYSLKATTLNIFNDGKIIYDPNGKIKKLISLAKKKIKTKPSKINNNILNIIKYFIEDELKDLKDSIEKKDIKLSRLIMNSIFNNIYENYFALERIRIPKQKYVFENIPDLKFKNKLKKYLESNNFQEEIKNLNNLSKYFIDKYGGSLPKEHKFKLKIEKTDTKK